MININTTLFDLDDIYTNLSHGKTWALVGELKEIKLELEETMEEARNFDLSESFEDIIAIEQQLYFLNQNLKTLETALLCHESKIFDKFTLIKDLQLVCLN